MEYKKLCVCGYLSSAVRDGLDGVGMSLTDADLTGDETGQGGADGPRRARGQLIHLLLLLVMVVGRQRRRRV